MLYEEAPKGALNSKCFYRKHLEVNLEILCASNKTISSNTLYESISLRGHEQYEPMLLAYGYFTTEV